MSSRVTLVEIQTEMLLFCPLFARFEDWNFILQIGPSVANLTQSK